MSNPSDSEFSLQNRHQLDVANWYRKVYALCNAKLISQSDAEDAAQETFARGFAKLEELRSPSAMGAWLRGIAHNVCVDMIRRNKVRQASAEAVDTIEAADVPHSTPPIDQLEAAVRQLPEPLREVILLHYYNDMTYDQMAEWLDVAFHRKRTSEPGSIGAQIEIGRG